MTNVDAYLKDIGVRDMLIPPAEEGAPPATLLSMLRQATNMGKGFDPTGGFAAVLLDPAELGMDTMDVFRLSEPAAPPKPEGDEAAPAPAPKVRPEPPIVLLVPGSGVAEVFEAFEPVADGKTWKLKMPHSSKPAYAMALGGYVAMSPSKEAIAFMAKGVVKAPAGIDPNALAIIQRGDVAVHMNMAKFAPVFTKLMAKAKQDMTRHAGPKDEFATMMFGTYENLFKELQSFTLSLRMTGDGVAFEMYEAVVPGSAMAKNLASQAGVRGGVQTLSGLPSLPYVLAIGTAHAANPGAKAASLEALDNLLKLQALAKVSDELKARTRKFVTDYSDELKGMQMVMGGAPAGSGVFGAAVVLKCQDSEKVRAMMGEGAALAEAYIKSLAEDPKAQQLKLTYTRGAQTIDGVSVDVLGIAHPDITDMKEDKKADMKKALAEDQLLVRVAAVGKDTAVITFGGAQAMMSEALKAAAGKGPIPTAPGTAAALKHLPANPSVVMLFNVANLLDVIRTGMTATGAPPKAVARVPQLKCQTPIAMGSQTMGNGAHAVLYIPTDLVKEGVPAIMGAVMPRSSGPDEDGESPMPREKEVTPEPAPIE
ncbi:MAG: hypothetical protein NTV86_20880 [Planctomycetota bacterium]|nr:hypothetical protein [Planctomycetota bacterium]